MIPSFVIGGLYSSQLIRWIDICKEINKDITTQTNPLPGKGIGYHVSCPSKPVQLMINTARFELGKSYNNLYGDVKNYTVRNYNEAFNSKRNNTVFKIYEQKYSNDSYLKNALPSLVYLNQILSGLEDLITCQLAQDMINYTEEKFCYLNLTYQFYNILYFLLGILGLLILSIGVNKLIVLLNPNYKNRGKKIEALEKLNETG